MTDGLPAGSETQIMRVLIVTPEYPPEHGGGIATYYRELTRGLQKLGHEVSVFKGSAYQHGGAAYKFEEVEVSVLETARYEKWKAKLSQFKTFTELHGQLAASFAIHEQAAEGVGFDAVEVTDWGMLFIPWLMSGKVKTLVQLHGSYGQIASHEPVGGREMEGTMALLLERAGLGLAPLLSSYSQSNVSWWELVLGRPVEYVPPPLGNEFGGTVVQRSGWITLGRMQQWKGPQIACAAWARMGAMAPVLKWFGRDTAHGATGASTSRWLSRTYPEVWERSICPYSALPPSGVVEELSKCRAVVIPSEWDVFNLVTAEAMACGCVVLVSSGAGSSDLIEHGRNGFLFPAGDDEALSELVLRVDRMSAEECRSIGIAAAQTITDNLDPKVIAARKIELYAAARPTSLLPPDWLSHALLKETSAAPSFLSGVSWFTLVKHLAGRVLQKLTRR